MARLYKVNEGGAEGAYGNVAGDASEPFCSDNNRRQLLLGGIGWCKPVFSDLSRSELYVTQKALKGLFYLSTQLTNSISDPL